MKKLLRIFFVPVYICSLLSCESDYDLTKDINMDITVGGDELAIPIGATEKILIDNLFDLEGNKTIITAENGDYYISMKDNNDVKPAKFKVTDVSISSVSPIIKPINFSTTKTRSNININKLYFTTPQPFTFSVNTPIPEEIISISSATFKKDKKDNYPTLDINIKFTGFPSNTSILNISNITLDLPEIMTYVADREIIGTKFISSGEVALKDGMGEYKKTIYVSGLKFGEDDKITTDSNGNKSFKIEQMLNLQGEITINPLAGAQPDLAIIKGDPTIIFSGANIQTIEGIVDINIEPIEFIYNTEFPTFLTEESIYLDLLNASVSMNVASNLTTSITANTKITAYKNNTYIDNSEIDFDLEINPAKHYNDPVSSYFWVSNNNDKAPKSHTWINRNLSSSIIRHVPETIKISLNPHTSSKLCSIDLNEEYELNLNYELLIPLMLGEKLTISYNNDFNDLQDELSDITDKISELVFDLETDNYIPLDMSIDPTILDSHGNIINNVSITIDGDIKSAEKDATNKTMGTKGIKSKTKIVIKELSKGVLKEINTIKMNIKANSNKQTEGTMLNKNQYLIMSMKVKIPGGISLNLNE